MAVQADRVKATYRDGVLEIQAAEAEELKPKENQDRHPLRGLGGGRDGPLRGSPPGLARQSGARKEREEN